MIHGDLYVRPPSAARLINYLFRQDQPACESPDDFSKLLWDMIIALIGQIPYTHEAQNTIIALVLELRKLAKDETQLSSVRPPMKKSRRTLVLKQEVQGNVLSPWAQQLSVLNSCIDDIFQSKGVRGREIEEGKFEAWTNLHAFLAKLFGRGFGHWRYIGILIFHDALEEHNSPRQHPLSKSPGTGPVEPTSALEGADTTGYMYSGEGGVCPERWAFWIKRAFELGDKVPEPHLRPLVLGASHRMVDISVLRASELMANRVEAKWQS